MRRSPALRVARVYLRVSTDDQDLGRQEAVVNDAKAAGWYVAGVYREKASGALPGRPELLRLIEDLQPGEVVIAEKLDRISRLPLPQAETLIAAIRAKGARLCVPGLIDLSEIAGDGITRIVLDAMEDLLLRIALQSARDDYELRRERQQQGIKQAKDRNAYKGRKPNSDKNLAIVTWRSAGHGIQKTAADLKCSPTHVKRVWKAHRQSLSQAEP